MGRRSSTSATGFGEDDHDDCRRGEGIRPEDVGQPDGRRKDCELPGEARRPRELVVRLAQHAEMIVVDGSAPDVF
ncbi:MAG: hypothetical protein JWN53_2034, partial [Gemmatimonadetes bacterium]|nr:hypothetical protein [Gemmatimonadota bacterium]